MQWSDQIFDQILNIFNANTESNQPIHDSTFFTISLGIEARVMEAGWQKFRSPRIRQSKDLKFFEDFLSIWNSTLWNKDTFLQSFHLFFSYLVIGMIDKTRPIDFFYFECPWCEWQ